MGIIQGGQRQTSTGNMLTWEMILPLPFPTVEPIPFMTDWQHSAIHPTQNLPQECELIALSFTHPNADEIRKVFDKLGIDTKVEKGEKASIRAKIKSPNGIFQI